MAKLYVCGRCGYRSFHRTRCHSCGFMLEEECVKCYSAKGNCICKLHGVFISGRHTEHAAPTAKKKPIAAKKKPKRKKKRKQ